MCALESYLVLLNLLYNEQVYILDKTSPLELLFVIDLLMPFNFS